jgi:hypothetical protein
MCTDRKEDVHRKKGEVLSSVIYILYVAASVQFQPPGFIICTEFQ